MLTVPGINSAVWSGLEAHDKVGGFPLTFVALLCSVRVLFCLLLLWFTTHNWVTLGVC